MEPRRKPMGVNMDKGDGQGRLTARKPVVEFLRRGSLSSRCAWFSDAGKVPPRASAATAPALAGERTVAL